MNESITQEILDLSQEKEHGKLTKEQIDIQRAKDSKDKAQKILNESSDDLEIKKAEVSLKKALARIELYGE